MFRLLDPLRDFPESSIHGVDPGEVRRIVRELHEDLFVTFAPAEDPTMVVRVELRLGAEDIDREEVRPRFADEHGLPVRFSDPGWAVYTTTDPKPSASLVERVQLAVGRYLLARGEIDGVLSAVVEPDGSRELLLGPEARRFKLVPIDPGTDVASVWAPKPSAGQSAEDPDPV